MLSKKSVELLKWLQANDEWIYYAQLSKKCPFFEYRLFNALKSSGYLDHFCDPNDGPEMDEFGNEAYPEQYRINDKGRAYLEQHRAGLLDKWITRGMALAALLISLTALLSQLGILRLQ